MKQNNWKNRIINFLEENRALVIIAFCLPASYIFDFILNIQKFLYHFLFSSPKSHDQRVRKIQRKVQEWHKLPTNNKKLLCTARPNWLSLSTKFFQKNKCHQIPINLFDILELDERNLTVRVEPLVTVDQITKFLIPKGYTLAVTLEIGDATLGGLALGTGMTTHSHQVGLYHENVISYEVILPDGSLMRAAENENLELYKTLPWSHGSLGFLVALTLKLVKIKPYVKITYIPIVGQENYCNLICKVSGAESKEDPVSDYVEATIFSKDKAVIMKADYSNFDPNFKYRTTHRINSSTRLFITT
ncbi:delta(24)-sterol reductase isoform X2 [Agrilus planipennis]|uniref:Delta(24)-sterol reductase n=1 Tax=Agrilus planipennis TaxID=224129 RepID=A0A1W4WLX9_AGRPL|nr:delta(24)-sterol reductase isoform X2 [Agrilus planipennis]